MTSFREIKTNFSSGEVSPEIRVRQTGSANNFYVSGAARLFNCYVRPQGGVKSRPGVRNLSAENTEFDGYDAVRVFPFQFSATQTYLIVLHVNATRDVNGHEIFTIFRSTERGFDFDARIIVSQAIFSRGFGYYWRPDQYEEIRVAQLNEVILFFCRGRPILRLKRELTSWVLDYPYFTNENSDFGSGHGPDTGFTQSRGHFPIGGGPSCGVFYGGRLWLAGFENSPSLIVGSRSASYFDFSQERDDADYAISLLASSSGGVASVGDLFYSRGLYAFTDSGVFLVGPKDDVPTPSNAFLERLGPETSTCSPVEITGGGVVFVPSGRDTLRLSDYSEERGGYVSFDISTQAHHLMKGLKRLAFQPTQDSTSTDLLFALREDGRLVVGSGRVDTDFGYAYGEWAVGSFPSEFGLSGSVISDDSNFNILDICGVYNGSTGNTDICFLLHVTNSGGFDSIFICYFDSSFSFDLFANRLWWRTSNLGDFNKFITSELSVAKANELPRLATGVVGDGMGFPIPVYLKCLPTDLAVSGIRGFEGHSAGKKKRVAWSRVTVENSGEFVSFPRSFVNGGGAVGVVQKGGHVFVPPGLPDAVFGIYTGAVVQNSILGWDTEAAPSFYCESPLGFQLTSVVYRVEISRS